MSFYSNIIIKISFYITYLQNFLNFNSFLVNFCAAFDRLSNYTSKIILLNDSFEKVHIDRQVNQAERYHDS